MKKMNSQAKKRVNDIFYSLQGEGVNTGRPAVFVRFSGCNLRCPFCDTSFTSFTEMTNDEIVSRVKEWPATMVILTGGEPTLQVDADLVEKLHRAGREVAMESNGTKLPPPGIDWLTVSPKPFVAGGDIKVAECNELKVLFDGQHPVETYGVRADNYCLQPCDTGDEQQNSCLTEECISFISQHPQWRLSLQTHKLAHFK